METLRNQMTVTEMVISDLINHGCPNVEVITDVVNANYFSLQTQYTTREIDTLLVVIYNEVS